MVRTTIGPCQVFLPDEAKRQARFRAGTLASGRDGNDALRAKRAELTLTELAEKYFVSLESAGRRSDLKRSLWRLHPADPFGSRRPSEVTHDDVGRWRLRAPKVIHGRIQQRSMESSRRAEDRQKAIALWQSVRSRGPLPALKQQPVRKRTATGERSANLCI